MLIKTDRPINVGGALYRGAVKNRRIAVKDAAKAWLFGTIPEYVREGLERKYPGSEIVDFQRGRAMPDLTEKDRGLILVVVPELAGWVSVRFAGEKMPLQRIAEPLELPEVPIEKQGNQV